MRPHKPIDWNLVDEFLEAGCPGTEIASFFDMHPNTFYDKVMEEHNIGFTEYCAQKRPKGEAVLRKAQYDKALGRTEKGDNTLLIFLGKTRLKQRETEELLVSSEVSTSFANMMNQLAQMQQKHHNSSNEKLSESSFEE